MSPLDPIFSPRSVAVIGASRDPSSIGYALLHNLVSHGFEGVVFPVNPKAETVHSFKCYPSVAAVPDRVDLAVVAVPRDAVIPVAQECVAEGVRGLVVITAGFAETGGLGAELEGRLREVVRRAGVRMVGPNCMGVINTTPGIRLNATFAPTPAEPGSIGFVSQSGALGVAILNVASNLGLGLTQFASMGNKADVSGNDLLEHWEDDDATRVIAMYLESFGNPRRFTEIAKRVGRKKPILVVKSGRTAEGAQAASSHTGALAGADITVSTFLEHCGVLRANTIEELFDTARAFDRCPLPSGRRVAIVTNAGGPAIMATDACVNLGLAMASISEETRRRLAAFLPAEASLGNPIDMIASASPEAYERSTRAVLADPAVDMALVINVTPLLASPFQVLERVAEAIRDTPDKPVLAVMMATDDFYETTKRRRDLPPVYRFPESAARALAMLARYSEWRRRPEPVPTSAIQTDDDAVAALIRRSAEGYLPPADAFRLLELYGIPTARWRVARSRETAVEAAASLGFPVVVKADAPSLIHKSDLGGVAVGLADRGAVEEAVATITARLQEAGHRARGFLVQEMVQLPGHEVTFGLTSDPRFGPLLMFGLGGKYVEVLQDVRFGVTPLTAHEADEMIHGIRGYRLLEGYRGEPGVDRAALREVLLRLGQLAQRHPEIVELDINPFLASADGDSGRALDVRVRVAPVRGGGTAA